MKKMEAAEIKRVILKCFTVRIEEYKEVFDLIDSFVDDEPEIEED